MSVARHDPLICTAHTHAATLVSLVALMLMFPLAALATIANGMTEHRPFLVVRQQLKQLRNSASSVS